MQELFNQLSMLTIWKLNLALINMVHQSRFVGSVTKDPHLHITTFLEYCNTLKCNGVSLDDIRLLLCLFLVKHLTKAGFNSLPLHTKDTWENLVRDLLERYFPPAKAAEFKYKITRFMQYVGESMRLCRDSKYD
jgi:hypothetical protein